MLNESADSAERWPSLPFEAWEETRATLHMWTQIVGKVRLALAPMVNHWWQASLLVTPRGLTTSAMPHGRRLFRIDFDFLDHRLLVETDDGVRRALALEPRSVADFHAELMATLREMALEVRIWRMPVEVKDPIPFDEDHEHVTYDPVSAHRFWRTLSQVDRVLQASRENYLGKCSPPVLFWGALDIAMTFFSGRRAPRHPGGILHLTDRVVREAYSHEVASVGWWPGSGAVREASFFAYAYPEPAGYRKALIRPRAAYYSEAMSEYLLPYESVRTAPDPDAALRTFVQSTYDAAAELGGWDRAALERAADDPFRIDG